MVLLTKIQPIKMAQVVFVTALSKAKSKRPEALAGMKGCHSLRGATIENWNVEQMKRVRDLF